MMNGCSAGSAIPMALALGLSVGIHVNLTEGVPLLAATSLPTLTTRDPASGLYVLRGKHGFRRDLAAGVVSLVEVRRAAEDCGSRLKPDANAQ